MRKVLLVVVLLGTMTTLAQPSMAGTVVLDDDLVLEFAPDSLTLRPFQRGSVELVLQNNADEAVMVAIEARSSDAAGGSRVIVTPDIITLSGGMRRTVEVEVESHATAFSGGRSDIVIAFSWGRNLTLEGGAVDPTTVEGSNGIVYPVNDDLFVSHPLYIGLMVAGVAALVAAVVMVIRRKRGEAGGRSGPR